MKSSITTVIAIAILFFQLGCSITQKNKSTDGPRVHNFAPAFIEFWDKVESKSLDEQLAALKKDFFPNFPQFYEYKIEKWKKIGKNPDEVLKKQLAEFPKIKDEFVKKTNEITNNLDSTLESFVTAVPGLDRNFDVYITHSFGDMDGGTRKIGDKTYFIFGIEGMVKYHKGFTSEIPFFHHELFHIYHGQYLPEDHIIWLSLWAEGLATYASEKLNPKASQKDLMLDLPEGMVRDIHKSISFHWNDLNSKLTSTNDIDYETYFLFSSKDKKVVKRAGYYLGYLIAKEIGKTKSISEMAQLKSDEILPLIKKAIGVFREN